MIEKLVNDDRQFYIKIRGDLISQSQWRFSIQQVESVKSMRDNLNALALIVRFLNIFFELLVLDNSSLSIARPAVQAQVITYAYQSNSTNLEAHTFARDVNFFLPPLSPTQNLLWWYINNPDGWSKIYVYSVL